MLYKQFQEKLEKAQKLREELERAEAEVQKAYENWRLQTQMERGTQLKEGELPF